MLDWRSARIRSGRPNLPLCEPRAAGHRADHPPGHPQYQGWSRWLTTRRRVSEHPSAVWFLCQAAAAVLQADLEQPAAWYCRLGLPVQPRSACSADRTSPTVGSAQRFDHLPIMGMFTQLGARSSVDHTIPLGRAEARRFVRCSPARSSSGHELAHASRASRSVRRAPSGRGCQPVPPTCIGWPSGTACGWSSGKAITRE
jgi:hypothetical protein